MADEKVVAEITLQGGVCRQIVWNKETGMYGFLGWGVGSLPSMTREKLARHLENDQIEPEALCLWGGVNLEMIDVAIASD